MSSLVEFLKERIDEDEAAAQSCLSGLGLRPATWANIGRPGGKGATQVRTDPPNRYGTTFPVARAADPEANHIARHDPARVLADCTARRRIIELHHDWTHTWEDGEVTVGCAHCTWTGNDGMDYPSDGPCETLRLLAAPYADHADFDPGWGITE
jgi:hypothetical protein